VFVEGAEKPLLSLCIVLERKEVAVERKTESIIIVITGEGGREAKRVCRRRVWGSQCVVVLADS